MGVSAQSALFPAVFLSLSIIFSVIFSGWLFWRAFCALIQMAGQTERELRDERIWLRKELEDARRRLNAIHDGDRLRALQAAQAPPAPVPVEVNLRGIDLPDGPAAFPELERYSTGGPGGRASMVPLPSLPPEPSGAAAEAPSGGEVVTEGS